MPDLDTAHQFLAGTARVLDLRRFERLCLGGDAAPVRDAVAAYRNTDGGFGQALEPDGRTPHSQPAATEQALRILHQADAWVDVLAEEACDQLDRTAPAEGGAIFVDPNVEGWPRAPWWQPEDGLPASLVSTGQISGTLHARGFAHPWLARATELMWELIGALEEPHAYELYGALRFLDHVPDRGRAAAALDQVEPAIRRVVTLDPDAPGEVHGPLGFAPAPGSIARPLFDDATIAAHLDHLAAGQQADGGWTVNFPAWSPAAGADWRGVATVDALHTLRENGRLVLD
ncbi:MAG TPA: hypothetical protein VEX67_16130 [Solirubrobacteraceae bacterium]|nr:hypothetical protein [Solirubrobacteraceae bacterium]